MNVSTLMTYRHLLLSMCVCICIFKRSKEKYRTVWNDWIVMKEQLNKSCKTTQVKARSSTLAPTIDWHKEDVYRFICTFSCSLLQNSPKRTLD